MTASTAPESLTLEDGVNANIRAEMARRNVSNVQMAERLDFSTGALWRRMTGKTSWNLEELGRVAEILGVSVHDLLRG